MSDIPKTNTAIGPETENARRDFLFVATGALLMVGTAATVWPLIDSLNPSADVRAVSAVEVDVGSVEVGERLTLKWRGQPVFVSHRTPAEIEAAEAVDTGSLRDPETDADRVQRTDWLVVVGICTHLGCVPLGQDRGERGDWAGWYCPCHGSHYDTSGRIRKGPAPENLHVPDYEWLSETRLRIG